MMVARASLLLAVLALNAGVVRAQLPADQVTGTLHVIWGDPPRGEPVLRYLLAGDDGSERIVDIDDGVVAAAGGLLAINGGRVRLQLEPGAVTAARPRARTLVPLVPAMSLQLQAATQTQLAVTRPYVTILCRFSDTPDSLPGTKESYERMMGPTYPGVNHYWTEVSEGNITLNGSIVVGWYTLPEPRSGYIGTSTSPGSANLVKLRDHCIAQADSVVNFASFSGINLQFNRTLDCCSWGGISTLTLDGVTRTWGMTWEASWASLGIYAHEVGHSLGLPHSGGQYGAVYDSRYDVMSSAGWYLEPITRWSMGSHTNGYHKDRLGIIPAQRRVTAIAPVTRVMLERSALPRANGAAQLVIIPTREEYGEFYTIESRRGGGYDGPLTPGVVIHQINPRRSEPAMVMDVDGNGNVNDAGGQWLPGEMFRDVPNKITVMIDSVHDEQVHLTVLRATPWLTLAGAARSHHVPFGSTAALQDSVTLEASAGLQWTAASTRGRVQLLTSSGSGRGTVRWQILTRSIAPGVYVDTVRIYAPGAHGHRSFIVDSLIVAEPTTSVLSASLSATSRSDSVLVGRTGFLDSVRVAFRGNGADTVTWSVTRRRPSSLLFAPTGGRGNGVVRWFHSASSLSPGVYVDTLTVSAPALTGSPLIIVDTVRVYALPAFSVTRFNAARAVVPEASTLRDSVLITPTGRWASAGIWQITHEGVTSYLRLIDPLPFGIPLRLAGSRVVTFERAAQTRAPGTYIDTLRITTIFPTNPVTFFIDTMDVRATAPGIRLSWYSRRDSVVANMALLSDSVWVMSEGPGASTRDWMSSVTNTNRITLGFRDAFTPRGRGTGSGVLRWFRNLTGRTPGLYVDTIRIMFVDSTASTMLIDSVFVLAPLTAALSTRSRVGYMLGSGATTRDSVQLTLTGIGNSQAPWSVESRAPWLTVTTSLGNGPGWLKWTRTPSNLAVGAHVDTIRVIVPGSTAGILLVVDSLRVVAPVMITSDSARPVVPVGRAHADTLRAAGGSGSYTWNLISGTLPLGLTLNATGVVSGQAAIGGEQQATVQALSVGFSGTRTLRFVAFEPPRMLTDSLRPNAPVGQAYADTLRAAGGDGVFQWTVRSGTLPTGLTLSSAGLIAGTPSQSVTARLVVRLTSVTLTTDVPLRLTAGTPLVTVDRSLQALMGASVADTLRATGGGGAISWSLVQGALPPGVTLASSGALSGIAERAGVYAFGARAVSGLIEAEATYQFTVTKPALAENAVMDQLLGTMALPATEARFLDLIGNRNGRVDIGDVRAWLQDSGRVAASPELRRVLEIVDSSTIRREPN